MKKLNLILLFLITFIFVSCNKDLNEEDNIKRDSFGINYIDSTNSLYKEFFDVSSKLEIKLDISEAEIKLLQEDYNNYSKIGSKSPIYRKGNLTIILNDKSYYFEDVGVRMKGNTSRTSFYNEEEGINDLIHYKISFTETFDKAKYYDTPLKWNEEDKEIRKSRNFAGMSKLNLKWNRNHDETYSKEIWTFKMFEEFNIMTAKMTTANFKLKYQNDYLNLGVFFVIENIDSEFLEKRLDSKHLGGDLYKVGWDNQNGGSLHINTLYGIGIEDEDSSYFPIYDLKTNKKTSEHEQLINLIETLNENKEFRHLVNLKYYLTFEAISYLSGNPDDFRNHYNNYYLYFLKDTNKMIIIPHDYDRVFGLNDWDPTGNSMTKFSPFTKETTIGTNDFQLNPLINKTIVKGSNDLESINYYKNKIIEVTESKYYNFNSFKEEVNIRKSLYNNLTYLDITILKNNNYYVTNFNIEENRNLSFNNYINEKIKTINKNLNNYE